MLGCCGQHAGALVGSGPCRGSCAGGAVPSLWPLSLHDLHYSMSCCPAWVHLAVLDIRFCTIAQVLLSLAPIYCLDSGHIPRQCGLAILFTGLAAAEHLHYAAAGVHGAERLARRAQVCIEEIPRGKGHGEARHETAPCCCKLCLLTWPARTTASAALALACRLLAAHKIHKLIC